MDLIQRPRRLRGSETLRKMVRETRIDKSSLIYPLFVREGQGIEEEIPSMEGQFRYSVDRLPYELERLTKAGVSNIMLLVFRIIRMKSEAALTTKTESYREHSVRQKNSSRISTILQTYACVSTLPTDTAVFYAVMK